ncbi:MAG: transglutaminase domain-containing protein [Hyphomicrobiales bacterium]
MTGTNDQYTRLLTGFLDRHGLHENSSMVEVYHAVRNIPYGRVGGRSAEAVIEHNMGSCSGKHILLRDALRHLKQSADVETVRGDFAAAIPPHSTMPEALQAYCRDGGITDFHNYVVWQSPDGEVKLDATWSDRPIAKGIPGNRDWNGNGDTRVALEPEIVLDRVEEVPSYKAFLLGQLGKDQILERERFLNLLTDWVATIESGGDVS